MTATKLSFTDRLVANLAAAAFPKFNAARLVRRVLWSCAKAVVLVIAARHTDGLVSVALYVLAVLTVQGFLFIGIAQRAVDERQARLALVPEPYRLVLVSKTHLVSKGAK
jgi:hypothetical protein